MIADRTRAGLAAARAKGVKLGRPRVIKQSTIDRGVSLVRERGFSVARAARDVGISYPYLAMALRHQ